MSKTSNNKENIEIRSNKTSTQRKSYRKIKSEFLKDLQNISTPKHELNNTSIKSKEKLDLSYWDLPKTIINKYNQIGITRMFEWQAECLMSGSALDGGNLIYSAPTSAGKTLVAELLMLKRVIETRKKAIMILPYVSVAREKMKHLQSFASDLNIRVDGFIGNNNPNGGFNAVDIAICTIEKANSLLNRLIEENKVSDLGVLVVDELHMVGDPSRGYLLELLLTKIQYLSNKNASKDFCVQIIGMSATLPNLNLLSKWLNASLYQTNFRPVPLIECLKYGNSLYDNKLNFIRDVEIFKDIESDNDLLLHLTYETIKSRLGVLIFCPTKSRCEALAENIAKMIYRLDKMKSESSLLCSKKEKIVDVIEQLKRTPAGLDSQLGKCISYGIAFHHAGLTVEERDIVENSFKENIILVIVATSTLSSGVNLPARRVIIRTPLFNGHLLDTMTYRQMIGRAGRKGIDTIGESILMCNNPQEKRLGEELIKSQLAPIKSCLITTNKTDNNLTSSMKRAILEIIASNIASETNDLITYLSCTLLNAEYNININQDKITDDLIEQSIAWLIKSEFITKVKLQSNDNKEILKATPLGNAVLSSSMSPDEGLIIFKELQKALQCFVLENELQIVYEITPINICDYWLNNSSSNSSLSCKLIDWNHYLSIIENFSNDKKRVANLVGVRESFIIRMIRGKSITTESEKNLLKIHLRFYTSLILNDLVNEKPFSKLIDEYKCQKGFLQQLQQSAATYAGMITIFCNRLGWFNLELLITQFQSRLTFGIQRELCDLIRISLLNSHRARLLYNNGYTNIKLLATAEPSDIEKIFRSTVCSDGGGGVVSKGLVLEEANKIFERKTVWNDGNFYTNWEATIAIINEAKSMLIKDVEFLGLKISDLDRNESSKSQNTQSTEKSVIQSQVVEEQVVVNESIESIKTSSDAEDDSILNEKLFDIEKMIEKKLDQIENILDEKSDEKCPVNKSIKNENLQKSCLKTPVTEISIQNLSTSLCNLSINESDLDAAAIALAHQVTSNKIDIANENENNAEKIAQTQNVGYTLSYLDNQNMILLADKYDNLKKACNTPKTPIEPKEIENKKDTIINTTIISDEILEICQMYENGKSNNDKRNSIFKTPLTPKTPKLTQSPRMQMIDRALETPKYLKTDSILMNNTIDHQQEDLRMFLNILPKNLHSTIGVSKVRSEIDFENLLKILKNLKTFLSISISYETETKTKNSMLGPRNIKSENKQLNYDFRFDDDEKNTSLKLNSLFLSFSSNNLIKIFIIELNSFKNETDRDKIWEYLKRLFDTVLTNVQKVCIQAKEKLKILIKSLKIEIKSNLHDPLLAYWLLENELANLNDLKQKYCSNSFLFNIDNVYRKKKTILIYSLDSEIKQAEAFLECLICLNSMDKLKLKLQLDNLWNYFTKIESEIMMVAVYMELNGIGFDLNECLKQMNIIKLKQTELEKKIYSFISPLKLKKGFSLNSPEDIANLLYVDLKLKPPILENKQQQSTKRVTTTTRIKHHSTAKAVLEKLSEQHELPRLILEWRQIQNSLTKTIYPVEKAKCFNKYLNMYRIHSTNDMCTLTGRLILNEPCLQIIPKDYDIFLTVLNDTDSNDQLQVDVNNDDENVDDDYEFLKNKLYFLQNDQNDDNDDDDDDDGDEDENRKKFLVSLRNAFIPYKNGILLAADYCQLELRIIAHLCKDKLLQQIINNDENDLFLLLASEWMGLSVDEISETQRQQTKQIVYGIIYGVSAKTLSKLLKIDENEASVFIEKFKTKFPGLKNFISEQLDLCRKNSYVETIKKRKRYLPNINSTNLNLKARAERQAINTIIQGSASDLVKTAIIKIDKQLNKKYPNIKDHTTNNSIGLKEENTKAPVGAHLVLQMHDELIYELNQKDLDEVYDIVKTNMENAIKFDVKMRVKIKIGKSWGSLKTYSKC